MKREKAYDATFGGLAILALVLVLASELPLAHKGLLAALWLLGLCYGWTTWARGRAARAKVDPPASPQPPPKTVAIGTTLQAPTPGGTASSIPPPEAMDPPRWVRDISQN